MSLIECLKELNPDMLANRNLAKEEVLKKAQLQTRTTTHLHTALRRPTSTERTIEYDAEFAPSEVGELRAGMRVMHQKFGKGKIISIVMKE